jgi:transcription antitermination factor NusG
MLSNQLNDDFLCRFVGLEHLGNRLENVGNGFLLLAEDFISETSQSAASFTVFKQPYNFQWLTDEPMLTLGCLVSGSLGRLIALYGLTLLRVRVRGGCVSVPDFTNFLETVDEREVLSRMSTERSADRWYALQLRTRWESSTATLLSSKGYQTFFPTYKTTKRGRGKSSELQAPLFPGYLFCRFNVFDRLPVLITPGVISVVSRGRVPIPVEDSELEAVQKMVYTGFQVEPCPYLEVGQIVRIEDGPLTGVEGVLTSFKGTRRMVVSISLLRRSVALEIDRSVVSPVQPRTPSASQERPTVTLLEPATA